MKIFKIISFSVCLLFAALSCNAPRENPVDPNNPDNKFSALSGIVKTKGLPFSPIEGINVFWANENILIQTTKNGTFEIPELKRNDGWLYFNKNGFSSDSVFIKWEGEKNISSEVFLNSVPVLDSLEFYSIVENRFQINQIYKIEVKAEISDFEGVKDIDSVFITNTALNIKTILLFNTISGFYERTLGLSDLNVAALDKVIGKDFNIVVNDLEGRKFTIGTDVIKRVINDEVELISPTNNEIETFPFSLRWKRFTPGFDFKYLIEISTNEIQPELVFRAENIPADSISYYMNSTFSGQDFFWTIWAIDEFQNRSRSKPGSFKIKN